MIYLLTSRYPYGKCAESFIENELTVFSESKRSMTIVPFMYDKEEHVRKLPDNVILDSSLADTNKHFQIARFIELLFTASFWNELWCRSRPHNAKSLFQSIKYLYGATLVKHYLQSKNIQDTDVLYSYWLSHLALGISFFLISKNHGTPMAISRAHGYDVYEEGVGMYFPRRESTISTLNNIFVVSDKGASFLNGRYAISRSKTVVSHLGVFPINSRRVKISVSDKVALSFISCSSVIELKRVDLIFTSICNYCNINRDKQFTWTHIGGGSLLSSLYELTSIKPKNLRVTLLGTIESDKVKDIYTANDFDIFINLSTTEGIPVSIMEALSFNIPIIATNVGGNSEIVTPQTGCLLSVDFRVDDFCTAVDYIRMNKSSLQSQIPSFFNANYNAEVNYKRFYQQIASIR